MMLAFRSIVSVVWIAGAIAVPAALHAQDRPPLADERDGASVATREIERLSFAGLDLAPDAMARVFRWPGGGWGVSARVFDGVLQRFDASGSPAGTVARSGEGPGELAGQVFGAAMDDELWIVDPGNARLSVFSEDFSLEGDRPAPGRIFSAASSPTGESVVVSGFLSDGRASHPVARISLDSSDDVFGGPLSEHPNPRVQVHMAAEATTGEVWTVAVSGGAVNVLDAADLTTLARLRLPGEALTAEAPARLNPTRERPVPQVSGIAADASGMLWVLVAVADRDWAPGIDPDSGIERLFDTRVLAIDAAERAVVGVTHLDDLCLPIEADLVSCVDEVGEAVRILRLELTHRENA